MERLERNSGRTVSASGRLNSLEKKLGMKERCTKDEIAQFPKRRS
jgi:hypothetical protein